MGFTFEVTLGPQPYPSWVLRDITDNDGNVVAQYWDAPVVMPIDGQVYVWDEAALDWIVVNQ